MNRQDHNLIASALKDGRKLWGKEPAAAAALDYVTGRLIRLLAEENPGFNAAKFVKDAAAVARPLVAGLVPAVTVRPGVGPVRGVATIRHLDK
jgi:hypothetical protein